MLCVLVIKLHLKNDNARAASREAARD